MTKKEIEKIKEETRYLTQAYKLYKSLSLEQAVKLSVRLMMEHPEEAIDIMTGMK